jgi:cysteine-rich repeat protein
MLGARFDISIPGRMTVLAALALGACQTGPGTWCGDGYCGAGYVCTADDGTWQCVRPYRCGNSVREDPEVCDDGNEIGGDGCSADCLSREICGDGVMDGGEACDDGNRMSNDGCSRDCASDETCGNSFVDLGERCDDGNEISGDGCSADCASDETCGNDLTDMGEVCDDGNATSGDGCSADCQSNETCGNGIVDEAPGEICDDGNNSGGDGCPAICKHDCDNHEELGYRVCRDRLRWTEAREACHLYGDHLVIINGTDENVIVSGFLSEEFWIGLSDTEKESDWRWVDGTRVVFASWYPGEPNDGAGTQDCAQANYASRGLWDDVQCDFERPFVCERFAGEPACGNGQVEPGEECDDGGQVAGDGCDGGCQIEIVLETEPNEDGSPDVGENDFATVNAGGPYEADTMVSARLEPPGDEDVFMVANSGPDVVLVRFDTHDAAAGRDVPCQGIDTMLLLWDTEGNVVAANDDRIVGDLCSTVEHVIGPGETVYAHVLDYGDDSAIPEPGYWLAIDFE